MKKKMQRNKETKEGKKDARKGFEYVLPWLPSPHLSSPRLTPPPLASLHISSPSSPHLVSPENGIR
jgi:hypothetical protein